MEKSEIIANLFLAYLDGKISSLNFNRALDVTAFRFIIDLYNFVNATKDTGFMKVFYDSLERHGISNLTSFPLIIVEQSTRDELRTDGHKVDNIALALYQMSSFGYEYQFAFLYGNKLRNSK